MRSIAVLLFGLFINGIRERRPTPERRNSTDAGSYCGHSHGCGSQSFSCVILRNSYEYRSDCWPQAELRAFLPSVMCTVRYWDTESNGGGAGLVSTDSDTALVPAAASAAWLNGPGGSRIKERPLRRETEGVKVSGMWWAREMLRRGRLV